MSTKKTFNNYRQQLSSLITLKLSPVQLNPSPVNPFLQTQVYEPLLSVHVALSWQPSSFSQLTISRSAYEISPDVNDKTQLISTYEY